MKIRNSDYGGFIVSKNITNVELIRYSYREKSSIPQFNGWTLYSIKDDDEYVNNSDNFTVLSASSMFGIAPVMREIFDAPYGTDICWSYEEGVHVGFYDLVKDRETTIEEILKEYRK